MLPMSMSLSLRFIKPQTPKVATCKYLVLTNALDHTNHPEGGHIPNRKHHNLASKVIKLFFRAQLSLI